MVGLGYVATGDALLTMVVGPSSHLNASSVLSPRSMAYCKAATVEVLLRDGDDRRPVAPRRRLGGCSMLRLRARGARCDAHHTAHHTHTTATDCCRLLLRVLHACQH